MTKTLAISWGLFYNRDMQSKKGSLIEAITNFIVGILTSFVIQEVYYRVADVQISTGQSITLTAIFTVASLLRSYVIRRIFNKYEKDI